jgi:hypothetical protein
MSLSRTSLPALLALLTPFVGCGHPPPPPPPEPPAPVAPPTPPPAPVAAPAAPSDDDDPDESSAPIVLEPEVTRPWDPTSFPKKVAGADEEKCWQTVNITGKPQADFEALVGSCGAPMGLVEYAKPAHGHLHSVNDKRDSFSIKLMKGLCYRYFAVGDSGIKNIDILVEKPGGALVGDDKQNGPVAIIDAGKTWCMPMDAQYLFNVEVHGEGKGKYIFGVWAKPK